MNVMTGAAGARAGAEAEAGGRQQRGVQWLLAQAAASCRRMLTMRARWRGGLVRGW